MCVPPGLHQQRRPHRGPCFWLEHYNTRRRHSALVQRSADPSTIVCSTGAADARSVYSRAAQDRDDSIPQPPGCESRAGAGVEEPRPRALTWASFLTDRRRRLHCPGLESGPEPILVGEQLERRARHARLLSSPVNRGIGFRSERRSGRQRGEPFPLPCLAAPLGCETSQSGRDGMIRRQPCGTHGIACNMSDLA
jgi:hypothetical protein